MQTKDGQVAQLKMTSEDEQQLLAENPALQQLYEAQVGAKLLSKTLFNPKPLVELSGSRRWPSDDARKGWLLSYTLVIHRAILCSRCPT